MSKIYIVRGITGEYEDYVEWDVTSYTNKKIAKLHAKLAKKEADKINYDIWEERRNPTIYDKTFKLDYTGTDYLVVELEFSDIKTEEEFREHYFLENL